MDITKEQYNEFKDATVEFIKKIFLNAVIAQNMVKDGKEWAAVNKLDGVLDQIRLLGTRFAEFPDVLKGNNEEVVDKSVKE